MTALPKVQISPEVRAELEQRGVDSVRGLLASMSDGYSGTAREACVRMGDIEVSRGDMEDWLWEAAATAEAKQDNRHSQMIRVAYSTLAIAVVAAIAGIVATVPVIKGWLN